MGLFEDEKISRELDRKMTEDEYKMSKSPEGFQTFEPYAVYIGEQDDFKGGHFSLYNIVGGKYDKTTMSEKSIKELGIRIKEGV